MPDVQYTINGQIAKGSLSQSFAASGVTANMATAGVAAVTLELSTTTSSVSTANLGAVGVCFARSLATAETHTVSARHLLLIGPLPLPRLAAHDAPATQFPKLR